jgi:hypothetical protein
VREEGDPIGNYFACPSHDCILLYFPLGYYYGEYLPEVSKAERMRTSHRLITLVDASATSGFEVYLDGCVWCTTTYINDPRGIFRNKSDGSYFRGDPEVDYQQNKAVEAVQPNCVFIEQEEVEYVSHEYVAVQALCAMDGRAAAVDLWIDYGTDFFTVLYLFSYVSWLMLI